jgi:hypothetical protein
MKHEVVEISNYALRRRVLLHRQTRIAQQNQCSVCTYPVPVSNRIQEVVVGPGPNNFFYGTVPRLPVPLNSCGEDRGFLSY